MKISVATLLPDLIKEGLKWGILGRAVENGVIDVDVINIRDYTTDRHRTTDDYIYGGGAGMVMKPEPLYDLYDDLICKGRKPYVIYASPQGRVFHSEIAHELAKKDELLFICGRYEGIDERCMKIVDDEISIGDYVTSGAEFPVLVMIDSISRFYPGVVGNYDSVINDSHYQGLLDHENYTRPSEYRGMKVPEVYLNGNHKLIDEARLKNSLLRTAVKRPDLFSQKEFSVEEKRALAKLILELYQDVE
ncbi:MAG: tRNA (guanine37-N1)-methyltransferase [Thermotogaceae bacterium]|nr:tRNA (guanine37-N1)-methyltransferase [Thermotogaceae bacterium]